MVVLLQINYIQPWRLYNHVIQYKNVLVGIFF